MARGGSRAIQGQGIPEAMEQILQHDSNIPPRINWLKPVSSTFAIGTGGPFFAEGPIISTGAAHHSLDGQLLAVTATASKNLPTPGAPAGMADMLDRTCVVLGKSISLRLALGGLLINNKKTKNKPLKI